MKTTYTGQTTAAGLFEKYVGENIDAIVALFDNMDEALVASSAIEVATGVFFFRYTSIAEQTVFEGVDAYSRIMKIPGPPPYEPLVYVNRKKVESTDQEYGYTVAADGTSVTFNYPMNGGDLVWVSAFGVNTEDGTYYFNDIESKKYLEILKGTEDIASLGSYTDPPKVVKTDAFTSGWDSGGANYVYDPDSEEEVDGVSIFAPAVGGRFKLRAGSGVLLTSLGVRNSLGTDQSIAFQKAVEITTRNRWKLLFDVDIDCGGADIWVNMDGTYNSTTTGTRFHWESLHRNEFSLTNAYLNFGKNHALVNDQVRWGPNTEASAQAVLKYINIEGCVRFLNIEGSFILEGNKFEPETGDPNFLSALPHSWAKNPDMLLSTDGNYDGTDPYTDPLSLVEFNFCNHMYAPGNNFQNGHDFINGAGEGLMGFSIAQCSNPLIVSGRTSHNYKGARIGSHPQLGGSGTTNVNIIGQHFEENDHEAYEIEHGKIIRINAQGRPRDDGALITSPVFRVTNAANAVGAVFIESYIDGPVTDPEGVTAVQIDGGVYVNVGGYIQGVGTGVRVNDTQTLGKIDAFIDEATVAQPIVYAKDIGSYVEDRQGSDFSPLAFTKVSRGDYFDLEMPNHLLREYNGTGVTSTPGITANYPAASANDMTAGFKVATAPLYIPDLATSGDWKDGLICSGSVIGDDSQFAWFIGVTTEADADTIPGIVTGAGLVTSNDNNFAGFLYNRYGTGSTIHAVARKNGTTPDVFDTGIAFGASSDPVEYRLELKKGGDVRFAIGGAYLDLGGGDVVLSSGISPTKDFGVVACGYTTTTTERNLTFPWLSVRMSRKRF